jgi:hypothetical protein
MELLAWEINTTLTNKKNLLGGNRTCRKRKASKKPKRQKNTSISSQR